MKIINMSDINNNIVNNLINDYEENSDVVMAEYLSSKKVPHGLTFEDAFEIYIDLMKRVEGDEFYTIKEGEKIEL